MQGLKDKCSHGPGGNYWRTNFGQPRNDWKVTARQLTVNSEYAVNPLANQD